MRNYLIKRVLLMIPMLFGITIISYFLMNLAPGDPVNMYVDYEKGAPSQEELQRLREQLGLDKPIVVRYFLWLKGVLQGDLGYSIMSRKPVVYEIGQRIGTTLLLSVLSMATSLFFGLLIGIICALNQYKLIDYVLSVLAFASLSIPGFWLGMMMIMLFTNKLGWLPSVGLSSVNLVDPSLFDIFIDRVKHLIMPVIAMSLSSIGSWARYQRSAFLEVVGQDYIRTARSKGLSERTITLRHAIRNSCLPLITLLGMSLPSLIGGAFLIESIFGLPGLGRLGVNAIGQRDYPVVMATTLFSSILVLLGTFLSDILYALVDPRIRYS